MFLIDISLTVSQTLKGSSGLKGFQCHWGGVRLVLGGGPGVHRSGGSPETHDTQFVLRSLAVQNLSCEVLRYKIRPARLAVQSLYCEVLRN